MLVFFVSLFVFTSALWSSGAISILFLNYIPTPNPNDLLESTAVISAASIGISQVLNNIPFVALYNLVMIDNGFSGGQHVDQWVMLAAASTLAGNLTILGAASTIIIIEGAESRGLRAFTFLEFSKVGSMITAANIAIYYSFIVLI